MSRHVPLRALASLAIAAPFFALTFAAAGAAHADPDPAPSPAPSVSAPASVPASPGPSASPGAPDGDTSLEPIEVWDTYQSGHDGLVAGGINGAKPGLKYSLSITLPARLGLRTAAEISGTDMASQSFSAKTEGGTTHATLTFTGKPDTARSFVLWYLTPTDGPRADVTASVSVTTPGTPDSDPSDNTQSGSGVVESGGSIRGKVWADANGNDTRDPREKGVAGVTVTLVPLSRSKAEPVSVKTTASGAYEFAHQKYGPYTVRVTAPAGWHFAKSGAGRDDGHDSDVSPATGTGPANLRGDVVKVDAGLVRDASSPSPAPSTGGGTMPTAAPSAVPTPPAANPGGSLPVTGASVAGAVAAGAALLTAGVAAVIVARRRRA